jgi:kynureninase
LSYTTLTHCNSWIDGSELVYLCGNSLGLQPKRSRELVLEELDVWAERGVQGHFDHPKGRAWAGIDLPATDLLLDVVGRLSQPIRDL